MGHFRCSTNYRTQKDNLSKPRLPFLERSPLPDWLNNTTAQGRVIRCRFNFSGKNDELPCREGAPGWLDRASGFPFPL